MRPNPSSPAFLATLLALWGVPQVAGAQDPIMPSGEELGQGRVQRVETRRAQEGAEFLLLPIGARAVGMGGAVTGMRGSGDLLLYNPAGVTGLENVGLLFNHSQTAFDTRSEVISLLWPFESLGTFGVTYFLVDYGELPSTSSEGAVQGTISFRNQEFLLTYANRLFARLEFGVNYKLIQLVYRCDGLCSGQQSFTRTTHAMDLGLIYDRIAGIPLALGASVRHLGFALKGANEDDPLPTRLRVGAAYEVLSTFLQDEAFALTLALDLEDQARYLGEPDVMLGSEFGVAQTFFLRAGYAFLDSGLGGPTLGFGLTYDWLNLDLSRGFDDVSAASGDQATQLTFGVTF